MLIRQPHSRPHAQACPLCGEQTVAPCHSPSGHPRRHEDNDVLTVGGTTRPEEPFSSPSCGVQEQAPVRLLFFQWLRMALSFHDGKIMRGLARGAGGPLIRRNGEDGEREGAGVRQRGCLRRTRRDVQHQLRQDDVEPQEFGGEQPSTVMGRSQRETEVSRGRS